MKETKTTDRAAKEGSDKLMRRESPHHEMSLTGGASIGLHVLVILTLAVVGGLLGQIIPPPPTQPEVITKHLGVDMDSAPDEGDGEATGDELEAKNEEDTVMNEEIEPREQEEVVTPERPVESKVELPDSKQNIENTQDLQDKGKQQATTSNQRMQDAKAQIDKNRAAGGGDGGGGGAGATGRAARPVRWKLLYQTGSPAKTLQLMEGLGAEIAFPGARGQWIYYSNLTAGSPTTSSRSLSGESRLYWMPEDSSSVTPLAQQLRAGPQTSMMLLLSDATETKMAKLELEHANLEEDEIQTTEFLAYDAGGGRVEIKVVKQIPIRK